MSIVKCSKHFHFIYETSHRIYIRNSFYVKSICWALMWPKLKHETFKEPEMPHEKKIKNHFRGKFPKRKIKRAFRIELDFCFH